MLLGEILNKPSDRHIYYKLIYKMSFSMSGSLQNAIKCLTITCNNASNTKICFAVVKLSS